ncbi:patatin-like phospholipase family protein [Leptolyngbya sp. NK1-12]|uniref:Patatin-like phospholipase family protein n=1 Tax=Leptolyngbya sp. NK1-12 TaxID=2547451 RepID=A0AA96WQH0_9CYAN|nr:patatin-like phospholipase family protein [Leptolyngbya sp. NK1-12]WNZ27396.1 patatin-like phospholipase family protein [Leptolyngbya sp. NK1-12]
MKHYRILTVDGGGVRGLISAIWLHHLQQQLSQPIQTYFDLISGTSSGSIIACGLAAGIDTQTLVNLLLHDAQLMFPSSKTSIWQPLSWLFRDPYRHPIYDGTAMSTFLQQMFGGMRFGELVKPTLATSYDMLNRTPLLFHSTDLAHANLPVWEVCRASTAIPAYFPPHTVSLQGQAIPCIDGAFAAKNPTMSAIAAMFKANQQVNQHSTQPLNLDQIVVASFGVGRLKPEVSAAQARRLRALASAVPLVHALVDGPADLTDSLAEQMLAANHYFRFQTALAVEDKVDDTDPAHLNLLADAAETYINGIGKAKLDALAQLLTQSQQRTERPISLWPVAVRSAC